MRSRTLILASALVAAAAIATPAARADDLTGAERLLCSAGQVTICWSDGECDQGTAAELQVPSFIEVDLQAKTLQTTKASGLNRSSPIKNLERDAERIVVHGFEKGRAFSFLIDIKTGELTASVAARGRTVGVFGSCTPMTAK